MFDKFVEFKAPVEENLGLEYDLNDYLKGSYVLQDEEGIEVDSGSISLEQDGTFAAQLTDLASGVYTFVLTVEDAAGNAATEETSFTVEVGDQEPPQETLAITLTPSTTEPTEGPVTISVAVESETEVVELKWLEGEKDVADFADAGNNIDLETKAFDVDKNGIYTVYAKTESGAEAVETITITNIV